MKLKKWGRNLRLEPASDRLQIRKERPVAELSPAILTSPILRSAARSCNRSLPSFFASADKYSRISTPICHRLLWHGEPTQSHAEPEHDQTSRFRRRTFRCIESLWHSDNKVLRSGGRLQQKFPREEMEHELAREIGHRKTRSAEHFNCAS